MSVVKKQVNETVTRETEAVVCDGPGCEVGYVYDANTHVPEGWRVLLTQTGARDYILKHFHSLQCLVNWVDREWPAVSEYRSVVE